MAQLDALVIRHNEGRELKDFRVGLVCAVIANVNRDPKKRKQAFKPQDFMLGKEVSQGKLPTFEEVRLMNIAAGGDDITQEKETKEPSQEELKAIVADIIKAEAPDGKRDS